MIFPIRCSSRHKVELCKWFVLYYQQTSLSDLGYTTANKMLILQNRGYFFIHEVMNIDDVMMTWLIFFYHEISSCQVPEKTTYYYKMLLRDVKINFKAMVSQSDLSKERRQQKVQPKKTCTMLRDLTQGENSRCKQCHWP